MPEPEQVEASDLQKVEAFALYNEVRLDIFFKYRDASRCLAGIVQGKNRWIELQSLLIALYLDFLPKLSREQNGKKVYGNKDVLLEPYLHFLTEPWRKMAPPDIMKLFVLMRELLEENGITKYETEVRSFMQQLH